MVRFPPSQGLTALILGAVLGTFGSFRLGLAGRKIGPGHQFAAGSKDLFAVAIEDRLTRTPAAKVFLGPPATAFASVLAGAAADAALAGFGFFDHGFVLPFSM
jgi:hypothetical protein